MEYYVNSVNIKIYINYEKKQTYNTHTHTRALCNRIVIFSESWCYTHHTTKAPLKKTDMEAEHL